MIQYLMNSRLQYNLMDERLKKIAYFMQLFFEDESIDLSYRVDRNGHRTIFAGNSGCALNHEIFTAS